MNYENNQCPTSLNRVVSEVLRAVIPKHPEYRSNKWLVEVYQDLWDLIIDAYKRLRLPEDDGDSNLSAFCVELLQQLKSRTCSSTHTEGIIALTTQLASYITNNECRPFKIKTVIRYGSSKALDILLKCLANRKVAMSFKYLIYPIGEYIFKIYTEAKCRKPNTSTAVPTEDFFPNGPSQLPDFTQYITGREDPTERRDIASQSNENTAQNSPNNHGYDGQNSNDVPQGRHPDPPSSPNCPCSGQDVGTEKSFSAEMIGTSHIGASTNHHSAEQHKCGFFDEPRLVDGKRGLSFDNSDYYNEDVDIMIEYLTLPDETKRNGDDQDNNNTGDGIG